MSIREAKGDTTGERFRTLMLLGEGGSATVSLAVARGPSGFSRLVALKTLKRHLADDAEIRRSFLHEARLSARLNHPNVVTVHEVTEYQALPALVMEYLEGQSMSALIARAGDAFTLGMRLRVLAEALSGLQYSHELSDYDGSPLGLVHRDFTPQNVFVTYSGQVKVLDFGVAKLRGADSNTERGIVKGKLRYMPPEQIRGEPLDRRTDLYAVGAMLWEAAAQQRLWRDVGDVALMQRVLAGRAPSPRTVAPECSLELERICMRALAPERADRYANALELQLDLEQYLGSFMPSPPTLAEVGESASAWFAEAREETRRTVERGLAEENTLSQSVPVIWADQAPARGSVPRVAGGWGRGSVWMVAAFIILAGSAALHPTLWQGEGEGAIAALPEGVFEGPGGQGAAPADSVAVRISVFPADAVIVWDGKIMGTSPYVARVLADNLPHVLRVEAPNHEMIERTINIDQDLEMVLSLRALAESPAIPSPDRAAVPTPPLPAAALPTAALPAPRGAANAGPVVVRGALDRPRRESRPGRETGSSQGIGSSRDTGSPGMAQPQHDARSPRDIDSDPCVPPYFVDERGVKKYKANCL